MKFLISVIVLVLLEIVNGSKKCRPDYHGVFRYNNKPCASTTQYDVGRKGACGCGILNPDPPFDKNTNLYTAAANQMYFDWGNSSTWCGQNCGRCVKLTPTGGFVPGRGRPPGKMNPQIFLVTNYCPRVDNWIWCGQDGVPGSGQNNVFGYEVHFDLQNQNGQVTRGLDWDNAETVWEEVQCPFNMHTLYRLCQCPRKF